MSGTPQKDNEGEIAGTLLKILNNSNRTELLTYTMDGREFLFIALFKLLRASGMVAEADTLKRSVLKRLEEEKAKFSIKTEEYLCQFTRKILIFIFRALENDVLHPADAEQYFEQIESTALRISPEYNYHLSSSVITEYVGYAIWTLDSHYLERATALADKVFSRAFIKTSERAEIRHNLALGYARLVEATGADYTPTIRKLTDKIEDPLLAVGGYLAFCEAAKKFQLTFENSLSQGKIFSLLDDIKDPGKKALACAQAAKFYAKTNQPQDCERFLQESQKWINSGFLLAEKGALAGQFMRELKDIACATRDSRHLEFMRDALQTIKPKAPLMDEYLQESLYCYISALLDFYRETGDDALLDGAKKVLGSGSADLSEISVLAMAETLINIGKYADARKLIWRIEDAKRSLKSFALAALTYYREKDITSFVQEIERALNHAAEFHTVGADAEEFVDILFDDVVALGRSRFFREIVRIARARYSNSESLNYIEMKSALALLAMADKPSRPVGARQTSPPGQMRNPAEPSERELSPDAIIEGLPYVKRLQVRLERARQLLKTTANPQPI